MNRNAERGRATREQLVDVAVGLFGANGYEHTSIEAVLRAAGVSRGSLYYHFSGKNALFMAVMERVEERVGAALLEASAGVTDAVGLLRAGALGWIRLAVDPLVQRVMLMDAPAVLGWERWRTFDEEHVLGDIRLAMAAAAEEGAFDVKHVEVFSHVLLAAVNEVALLISRADDQAAALASGEAAVEEFLERLLGKRA